MNSDNCNVIWLFVKRLSQEAIQRRSQSDRLVKIKVFKLRRDADDIPCNITLRSAGGEAFHSAGPTTAKDRFWDREVRDQGNNQMTEQSRTELNRCFSLFSSGWFCSNTPIITYECDRMWLSNHASLSNCVNI